MSVLPQIAWPIPSSRRGSEFKNQEEILSHLGGESTGLYMIGRSGMWHGGIHITEATTPWCALSGKSPLEAIDFPVPFKGEQAIRCMADGEVIAYRICRDYLTIAWESGPLNFSGSFVLVKHYIQPGEKETSGLHFYTLYMHLAPYSAYEAEAENQWVIRDTLKAYSEMDWLTAKLTSDETSPQIAGYMPEGARVEWNPADSNLNATGSNKRKYGLVTLKGLPEKNSSTLTPGQRYWVVVDNNNVKPAPGAGPGWWRHLLPPAKEAMVFDKTVSLSSPFAIKAGDPIGHMGYYQAPKDGGYEARYQVHIECTSMDDNLEKFLTNPEQVGKNNPLWLKYAPGLALYKKDAFTGTFTKDARVTTRTGILPLKQVQTEVDKSTKQEYWQLRPENAYVPKDQVEPQLLSQYDLAKLGFRTEIAEPTSFDYLDGKKQPTGFFRSLINSLYEAAIGDTRTSHALVKHNYQRLLDKIDSGSDRYSPMEYWRALHNPDYRDVLQKTIVKHPSDWYFKKDDTIWQPFLNALKKDAPEWKKYSEDFLDKMAWMQDVTTEKLGPSLWHMHPIMFLASLIQPNEDIRILRLRAFLRMIRIGEGTIQEDGYRTMFTGVKFTDFSKHPNIRHEANDVVSTAAGAYQFLYGTWRNLQRRYSFPDFSPSNQDLGCIALIAGRKALDVVMQGKISEAIHLCRIEWASLPGSPHGQPTANKKMIMEKYELYLAEEKEGKTSLHATTEKIVKFIEGNYPEYL
ncbi:glycoside hydrolase family 104 protein [Escherichia coli]|uniref:glycoside hydrolase family 24 protein n=1 Tax=Escherichia coli TaxID=562 RepID=UPI0013753CA6|nr:glycoside hydrolase family 104 protein [Escherichia coli]EKF1141588.1 glycoside hydrolase family 104 protein [Escherichia coli]ELA5914198.1 glycoside hydrolase family 104 protein [Escherichia coli]ELV0961663.1 glycoside hydrolase family 104 protein [Escherichia coli]EMD3336345.1 glycoside hydrolase family 104 protein [Escherichia coli]MBZ8943544.1 glycoside hydrolase family 104 protein [Escherichia coli]